MLCRRRLICPTEKEYCRLEDSWRVLTASPDVTCSDPSLDESVYKTASSDVNKDLTFKAKDKDQTLKAKDQDKD